MKISTNEWLNSALDDLNTIKEIIKNKTLTNVVAFHCQQCVEKCFKALIEEFMNEPQKTHNLLKLYEYINPYLKDISVEYVILEKLNLLYIDSRYPSEFGILPNGKPSLHEAEDFYSFTLKVYEDIRKLLNNVK